MTCFWEKVQKPEFFILNPLNPRIKIIFQNFGRVTFFTLLTPNFMQSFRKTNEQSFQNIWRRTDGQTTDGLTRAITMDLIG